MAIANSMKETLRWYVAGSSMEKPVRRLWNTITGSPPSRYDVATGQIIARYAQRTWNCADVGANVGDISDILLASCPEGQHWLFEPLPTCAALLRRKYRRRANVKVFELALSDTAGTTEFHYNVQHPATSGIREQRYFTKHNPIELICVETERLDAVLASAPRLDFIKIDVEGAELLVLRGGQATLAASRPLIVFEHGKNAAPYYDYSCRDVFAFFDCLNYGIYRLIDVLESRPALGADEFIAEFESGREWYFAAKPREAG